jgi:hypothetical protein
MSIYTALADNVRRVRLDLTKCATAAPRKESALWSCLQQLDQVAKVLEGNFEIATPDPVADRFGPRPSVKRTGRVLEATGNVIKFPARA